MGGGETVTGKIKFTWSVHTLVFRNLLFCKKIETEQTQREKVSDTNTTDVLYSEILQRPNTSEADV